MSISENNPMSAEEKPHTEQRQAENKAEESAVAVAEENVGAEVQTLELLERLEPAERRIVTELLISSHRGPLPSPETMAAYEKVIPGLPKQLTQQFDNQVRHRIETEREIVKSQISLAKNGQWMAFVLTLFLLIAGVSLAVMGHPEITEKIFTVTIVGVVASFLGVKFFSWKSSNKDE